MLYGRDARLTLGVEFDEVVSKPTHGPAKYLEDLKKRQIDLRKMVRESNSPRRNRNVVMIHEIV